MRLQILDIVISNNILFNLLIFRIVCEGINFMQIIRS